MASRSAFETYLRTGRGSPGRVDKVQLKFNPWHDPKDGRFTFAGQGNRSAGGAAFDKYSPLNPRNHSIHSVKRGETLTSIAAQRKGLTVADLARLNGISPDQPLRIGQQLKLPNQSYLDAGRDARNNFLALAHYMDTHDGHLPPNVAHPPSMETQVEAEGVRTISKNGYGFDIDALERARRITGEIDLQPGPRSKTSQADAGKPDRLTTDDGGHYIAARFNGPRDWFNHFAQDANFNRGAYRALEDKWAKSIRSGRRIFVDIVPQYRGTSKRPYKLIVTWLSDGKEAVAEFSNEKQGR